MPIHRRDFMKILGVSAASLLLTRCNWRQVGVQRSVTDEATCYEPVPVTATSEPTISSARERLRLYWLRFDELAQKSPEDTENKLGQELVAGHRAALDELVANGETSAPVADLVQEAYTAAVHHVWRSNVPILCYDMAFSFAPNSAAVLVTQSQALSKVAEQGTVDPDTLAKAQAALEHDLAFYALTDEEVQALYKQLGEETEPYPSFEELPLELTPEAQAATQFIVDLLTGK